MGEIFKEQIVPRASLLSDTLKKAGLITAVALLSVAAMLVMEALALAIVMGGGVLCWFLFSYFDVEYEYAVTGGRLEIDCIYGKARRKSLVKCDASSIELFTFVGNDSAADLKPNVVRDYSSRMKETEKYYFIVNIGDKKTKIIFEPNPELLAALLPFLGSRKILRRR